MAEPFETDVKRFYLPGQSVSVTCPHCKAVVTQNFNDHYLSYPRANEPIDIDVYGHECDGVERELSVRCVLRIELAPAP